MATRAPLVDEDGIAHDEVAHAELTAMRSRPTVASSWVLVFFAGALLLVESLFWAVRGRLFDIAAYERVAGESWLVIEALLPRVDRLLEVLVRLAGLGLAIAALFSMIIAATSYRRGERWAWYATWLLFLVPVLDAATLSSLGALTAPGLVFDVVVGALALLGLVLPYPPFFTEEPEQES
jgi:hypothetical protein